MKKITSIILLLIAFNLGYGQIVSWEMNTNAGNEATFNATTLNANLNTVTLSRGSGLSTSALANSFSSNNFTVGGIQSDAETNGDYLEFQISAMVGYEVSMSTLDANFRRSSTGPDSFLWKYSTDGVNFTDIGTTISYTSTATNGTAQTQIDLSAITALQDVDFGTTVTFRLYGWGASGSTGSFAIGRLTGDDLSFGGTVSAVGSCTSVTTWDGTSWDNGTPDLTAVAVIDGDYTTDPTDISFSACSLIINAGNTLNIDNGYFVEIENDVTVEGNLTVQTSGSFVQNDSGAAFTLSGAGTSSVNKQTPAKALWYYYTYWSSPVVGETVEDAFPSAPANRRLFFNANNYLDADSDYVDDNNDAWTQASGVMTAGVGYIATESTFHIPGGSGTADFEGPFNTGNVDVSIAYDASNSFGSYNLIGNPYPSAIDFVAFQAANSAVIDGVAYLWSQATDHSAANPGNQASNFSRNDYATYTVGTGGAAGGGPDTPTQYIPSGQGFFVSGLDNNTATFTNAFRMADGSSNSQFFKNADQKTKKGINANKLWVNLTSDNGVFNQILIGYVHGASDSNDGLSYDAPRFLSPDTPAALYSIIEGESKKYVVQGKNENSINDYETIRLGLLTNIEVATLYKLSLAQFQGDFISNNAVYLIDNALNKIHNLSDSDYTFTSEVGEFNDRFVIAFNANALSTNETELGEDSLRIVNLEGDKVQFTTSNNTKIKTVGIYDLLGRNLYNLSGDSSTETFNLSKLSSSAFVAKVTLSNGTVITKKATKK